MAQLLINMQLIVKMSGVGKGRERSSNAINYTDKIEDRKLIAFLKFSKIKDLVFAFSSSETGRWDSNSFLQSLVLMLHQLIIVVNLPQE